jgi:hypothetical protein
MLHAIHQKKTKYFQRYLGKRDGQEVRVQEEDEITSTFLGPMEFLDHAANYEFWCVLLSSVGRGAFLLKDTPSIFTLKLWDRRAVSETGRFIEPDAVVRMQWSTGEARILLIEFKWRAALSGQDQLQSQWSQYLDDTERANALHIFIAPETSTVASTIQSVNKWEGRLMFLPWLSIRSVLSKLLNLSTPLGRWAKLADSFLESVGIRTFSGFKELPAAPTVPLNLPITLFWNQTTFWSRIGKCPGQRFSNVEHIFFKSSQG